MYALRIFIRVYSSIVLAIDLIMLLAKISFSILIAIYRVFKPPSLKSLHGEIAMVVGGGRGVGQEIAIQLCQLGVTVACVDISTENCRITQQRALELSQVVKLYICDVTDKDEVALTVNTITSQLGEITMLFHCCGVPSPYTLIKNPPEIRHTINLSVLSHFWLLDSILPCMQRAKKGHIILLSSVAGLSSTTFGTSRVSLSTAQFAVQGLAESLHAELRHINSKVIITLIHVYPFIIGSELATDIRFRIPSFFGTMPASEAARKILDGVRRNYPEFSVPGYLLYLGHVLRILPKKASFMLRDLLDIGIDFG